MLGILLVSHNYGKMLEATSKSSTFSRRRKASAVLGPGSVCSSSLLGMPSAAVIPFFEDPEDEVPSTSRCFAVELLSLPLPVYDDEGWSAGDACQWRRSKWSPFYSRVSLAGSTRSLTNLAP